MNTSGVKKQNKTEKHKLFDTPKYSQTQHKTLKTREVPIRLGQTGKVTKFIFHRFKGKLGLMSNHG